MDNKKVGLGIKIKKIMKIVGISIGCLYLLLLTLRFPFWFQSQKSNQEVAKIHSTKLSLADVTGSNLPPDPGSVADTTIQGIDVNHNGIQDDVELAIFQKYPNSAKTRSALLQYALALQTQLTLPIVNTETVTATVEDLHSRANICIWTLSSRDDMTKFSNDIDMYETFVKNLVLNTPARKEYLDEIYKYLRSYTANENGCDINPLTLPN